MGIAPSSLIGKNIETVRIETWPLDIIENVKKTFREGSQDWLNEIDNIVFRSHTTLTRDDKGNITGIVGSSDDVTELIKLQRDLQAAVKTAENANRSKSSFLARMSHEIRTPLNAVLGIAEIQLQNESIQPDAKEAYTRIFNSGNLLLGIVNNILDMSKIEAGKLELIPAKYDVANMINDTVYLNMVKHEGKQITFNLNVDENIPSQLLGDELRLKQILNNLLSNAFKYTDEGEVELSINAEYASNDTITLVFRVRDTGQGMTPDQIGRLYDEYSRFNMEANMTTIGTGLGMGITQNLVRMMNGEILVESERGRGSLFIVRLRQGNTGAAPLGKETAQRLKQFRLNYKTEIEKTETPVDVKHDSFIKEIEKIKEIDTKIGIKQVAGSKEMYRNTLEIFYKKIIAVCNDMTSFLEATDMENFAVSVHSTKTMLAIIGATNLSEMALTLERASEKNGVDFCILQFAEFKEELLSLHRKLAAIFQVSENPENESKSGSNDLAPAGKKSFTGKILLVDDTKMVLYVIKEKMLAYGLQVDTAASGHEAIEKIKTNKYDLVLMDYKMPKMNGIEATMEIRKLGAEYEKLAIIALTANVDTWLEEKFLAAGFNGFLSKPVETEKLEEIFKEWL
jgi:signal transduction histidine kinase/CheY-like chemotaxis protein/HPt (histidine-containing phosphotransfer) domain-containing protein